MIHPSNKIIIVDNELSELEELGKVFNKNGICCRTIVYDQFYDKPLSDVRLAFFDVNLNPSSGSEEQIFASLADAIKIYISNENPPFALIFWTKNTHLVDSFITFVKERDPDVPIPFLINCIDKSKFVDNPEGLSTKLNELLNEKAVELLFDFESKSYLAGTNTINKILELIPRDKIWGENKIFSHYFERVFAKIATETLGYDHAKKNPDRAICEALIPILNHNLLNIHNGHNWKKLLNILQNGRPVLSPELFDSAKLNTIFHVDSKSSINRKTRGGVFRYSYSAPNEIYRFNNPLFYFRDECEFFNQKFKEFIRLDSNKVDQDEQNEIIGKSIFVVVEISAACDYSQDKDRNCKYVMGLLVPVLKNDQFDTRMLSESIYKDVPEFYWGNSKRKLLLNFNFVFSNISEIEEIKDSLFILKKELIDMIGNRYASHVSRIGITSFS